MKCFIGAKIIQAEPLTLGEYNKRRGWVIPADEDPNRPGYFVAYPDNYNSWSPKEVFEEAYRPVSDGERELIETHNPLQETFDHKTTRVASERELGEAEETGGHHEDRDGPIPFNG